MTVASLYISELHADVLTRYSALLHLPLLLLTSPIGFRKQTPASDPLLL